MSHDQEPFEHALNSARAWLTTIAEALDTRDRHHAYRIARAWLHVFRDRLTVDAAAHLGAQLPEVWRGIYYEGWVPGHLPVRYRAGDCLDRVATEAGIRPADAARAMSRVTEGLRSLFSPGTLEHALDQLPRDVRELFTLGSAHRAS